VRIPLCHLLHLSGKLFERAADAASMEIGKDQRNGNASG